MKRVNSIDYYVKLFQVKTAIVNCTNLGIKLLRILFVHIRNVDKTDMHVTKIWFLKSNAIIWMLLVK